MKRLLAGLLALAVAFAPALALSADKKPLANYGGGALPIKEGDVLQAPAPTTGNASLNLPQGTVPTSPANGDIWLTTAGMYARVNGSTVGPFGAGSVTSVTCGTGLSGGTITTTGTCSITAPVTVALGGTNATSASGTAIDNISGFASTGFLTRTGAGAYSFQSLTNGISLGNIAQIAANTVIGNATASTANMVAQSMPSCSAASSALTWTTSSGFGCNTISGGSGTVTTTGSPASGNLTKFSGAASVTSGDLSGDCTTSGTLAITCTKTSGTSFGTFATQNYATPPAIGGTTPAAGSFSTLSATGNLTTNVTGSTQCLQANSSGVVSGSGSTCGGGSSGLTQLAQITTAASQTTIDFTSISGSYTNLRIVAQVRSQVAAATDTIFVRFNNDSGANYDQIQLPITTTATPASAVAQTQIALTNVAGSTTTANYATAFTLDIPNYSKTTFNKSCVAQAAGRSGNATPGVMGMAGGDWNSTAAITRVTLILNAGGAFVNGLVFTLYGLS
jgi:hypothetical protein